MRGDEVRLGRGTENEVVLPDFSVSRRHAAFRREGTGWVVYDLMSTNGIQVNRAPVKRAPVHGGDVIKVGIFELALEGKEEQPTAAIPSGGPTPGAPRSEMSMGSATIIRPIAAFQADYGLEQSGVGTAAPASDKRKALEQAYGSKIFGYMTRLSQMLIRADSVDDVLARVMEIAFEALPVDRGFILLREEDAGESVCELARIKDRIEFRPPRAGVPISRGMLEEVMRDRVALLTYDAAADQRLAGGESIRIHQIRAAMCAPLWSGEKIIGVMQVDTPFHAGQFNEQDLDLLTALANYAAVAVERLRYAKRAEFERQVRSRLERYHSPAVIEEIVQEGAQEGEPAVRRLKFAVVSVLFADLVGFTALSERLRPEEVADVLAGYFTHSIEAIFSAGGTLDKFIGDCVMAFFGAPMAQADHALRGVQAAIEIQRGMERWNVDRAARGLPALQARIAVNSGPVVVGDIGSARRVDYTVLGNTVNVAARLEESVAEPGGIAIGGDTFDLLAGAVATDPLGEFQLKGLQRRVAAHRVRWRE